MDKETHCPHSILPLDLKEGELSYKGLNDCTTCGNCNQYEDRPRVCREYACDWKSGLGDDSDRPDISMKLLFRGRVFELGEGKD
tara:strand:+ start:296 stop:547 length:252 start_codon:yes stop_codon:yes gene_type:complete